MSFKEESLARKLDSTLVKHRAPCIAHRDGRPRQSDATGLESVFVHYKAGLGTQVQKGLTKYLGPTQGSPQPTNLWLKGNVRSECPPQPQGSLTGIWWPNLAQVLPARTIEGHKNLKPLTKRFFHYKVD